MGYTHYWRGTAKASDSLIADLQHLLESTDVPLAGWDGKGKPVINTDEIRFNGLGDDAYETFAVEFDKDSAFTFCKTGHAPYDEVVVAALFLIEAHSGGSFSWSSDGDAEDHAVGRETAYSILGHL